MNANDSAPMPFSAAKSMSSSLPRESLVVGLRGAPGAAGELLYNRGSDLTGSPSRVLSPRLAAYAPGRHPGPAGQTQGVMPRGVEGEDVVGQVGSFL